MTTTLGFDDLLRLIDERSAAFRASVAAAPSLDARVPTCPEWTLFDLAEHLGDGRRAWAATVAAGPAEAKAVPVDAPPAPRERAALLAWLAESTDLLQDALRESGPDRGCWTWWRGSQSPQTAGAVARHQLQQVAVHTYDAQLTGGSPQPLPEDVALDGVDEFLSTCCAGPYKWPYKPAVVAYGVVDGPSWRVSLAADGVRVTRGGGEPADASFRGTAGELVLALYGRVPAGSLTVEGDAGIFDLLLAWEPEEI